MYAYTIFYNSLKKIRNQLINVIESSILILLAVKFDKLYLPPILIKNYKHSVLLIYIYYQSTTYLLVTLTNEIFTNISHDIYLY
jgi:hypothetical protein